MKYKVVNLKDGVEIQLSGSFTFRDHDTFFEVVSMIKTGYNKKMIFDFSACDFLDSAALGMLVIAHDEAAAKEVSLVLRGLKGHVKQVLYAARFDTLYDIED